MAVQEAVLRLVSSASVALGPGDPDCVCLTWSCVQAGCLVLFSGKPQVVKCLWPPVIHQAGVQGRPVEQGWDVLSDLEAESEVLRLPPGTFALG